MAPRLRLLSLGAGVQSTALALMAARGEFPEPLDGAIFADTQWEPPAVYAHLAWLETVVPFPIYRVSAGNLLEAIKTRQNTSGGQFAAVPWHVVHPDGSVGMGRRQCTAEYKLKPIMRQIRTLLGVSRRGRIPAGAVEQWIGISIDEASRMRPAWQAYITNRWPLVERHLSRAACVSWLTAHGYPVPGKSACIGCPFHNGSAWRVMKRDAPAEFAHAVEVDAILRGAGRGGRGTEYMHGSRRPLAEAVEYSDPDRDQLNLFDNECTGMCGL